MGGLFGGGQTISSSEPRLGALRVQTSAYGYPVPIIYGKTRVSVNLLGYYDFVAIPHTSTQSAGGKGGGGVTQENTTYSYQTAAMFAIGEGPINDIGTIWTGKKQTSAAELGLTLFKGTYPQTPWGYLTTYHAGEALGYHGLSYLANGAYQLGGSAELSNHNIEVDSTFGFSVSIRDASPAVVVPDFLTNVNYGACPTGFPLGSLTQYSNYCVANGLFISPAMVEQREAREYLAEIFQATNSAPVWSEGVLKIIPYGDTAVTGNGATFTPDITPQYDLTDDDFLAAAGTDPVQVRRKTNADAYNQVQIEFINRANQYNVEIAEAKDLANIEQYGLRPMAPVKLHCICDAAIANLVAQILLQRALYIRNEYEFNLGWRYCRLEPMDIVTLTDSGLGLSLFQVRLTSVEEADDGELTMIAEEFPFGVAHAAQYSYQTAGGYNVNYNEAAVASGTPVIFEAPIELAANSLEAWLAVAAIGNWGGCDVWVSSDDVTYRRVGTINGAARMGTLSQLLPAGSDPDTTDTLSVDLTTSAGTLLSGTQADADSLHTLCYVDGELLAYQTATLTAANKYNLTYLRRGAYNTGNSSHNIGSKFVRLDDAVFRYAYTPDQIGKTLYFKFPAFNIYGGGQQDLAAATAHSYTLVGPPAPPDVQNFAVRQNGGAVVFTWVGVANFGLKGYDIRYAAQGVTNWAVMTPLTEASMGTEMTNASVPPGAWVFAIRARDMADQLSPTAATYNLTVTNESSVILSSSEAAKGWPGTVSGFVKHWTGVLVPDDQHTAGYYGWEVFDQFVPTPVASCTYSSNAYDLAYDDTLRVYSVIQAIPGPGVSGTPSTSFSIDVWLTGQVDPNVWNAWTVGAVQVRYIRGRVIHTPGSVPAYINAFTFNADALAASKELIGSLTAAAGGTAVTFSTPYHFPPFVAASFGGSGAYIATASNITETGFTAHVFNTSGTDVGGAFSWKSSGV